MVLLPLAALGIVHFFRIDELRALFNLINNGPIASEQFVKEAGTPYNLTDTSATFNVDISRSHGTNYRVHFANGFYSFDNAGWAPDYVNSGLRIPFAGVLGLLEISKPQLAREALSTARASRLGINVVLRLTAGGSKGKYLHLSLEGPYSSFSSRFIAKENRSVQMIEYVPLDQSNVNVMELTDTPQIDPDTLPGNEFLLAWGFTDGGFASILPPGTQLSKRNEQLKQSIDYGWPLVSNTVLREVLENQANSINDQVFELTKGKLVGEALRKKIRSIVPGKNLHSIGRSIHSREIKRCCVLLEVALPSAGVTLDVQKCYEHVLAIRNCNKRESRTIQDYLVNGQIGYINKDIVQFRHVKVFAHILNIAHHIFGSASLDFPKTD